MTSTPKVTLAILLAASAALGAGLHASALAAPTAPPTIRTLANRADLISGPSTLVQLDLPSGVTLGQVAVDLDGRRIDSAFAVRPNGKIQGIVDGLRPGSNVLSVRLSNGSGAQLVVTDHPIGGPVIAGPQVQPWICNNQANGAGAPRDAQCDTDPIYTYQYKSSITGQFAPYNPASPPLDVASTTTDRGVTVPYVVRIETGVIDRGVYQLAVLDTPGQPWALWAPQPAWNGKLAYHFNGDCTPDHSQGPPKPVNDTAFPDDTALSRGFMQAVSGNTTLGQDCNSVVSAETVMMIKEHIANTYGPIRYTISDGCSGGSMQQHWDVSDFPGLLDGIIPSCSFPDIWETVQEAEDCHLLDRVFDQSADLAAQQKFVTGYAAVTTCRSLWDNPTGEAQFARTWLDPDNGDGCLGGINALHTTLQANPAWVYDAATKPTGVRCTLQDYQVAVFGTRASDGFANRPFSNAGVQYGFNAVNSGEITPQQFVDLNAEVGGLDIDWNWQPQRSTADPAALDTAYRAGLVTYPKAAASVPIIDLRGADNVEIHTDFHSYVMRARLDQATGGHANQVIWTTPTAVPPPAVSQAAFLAMDTWLSTIEADKRAISQANKVVADKPEIATDSCWINGQQVTDTSTCRAAFPYFADPRIAAGAPLADNLLQCKLKPLDPADYTVTFTPAQWDVLETAFPAGVCDYDQPGVGQQPSSPWMTFTGGPGGEALGPAPTSSALAPGSR